MCLFDDITRSDPSPSRFGEDTFSFYNRVDGVIWQRIRDTLEAWFAEYPTEHAAQLRGAFRSNREGSHVGALWELYLHHLLGCLGYQVRVHPEVPDTSHQPDFEARRGNERLYVEATVVFSGIVDDEADAVREGWILDAANKVSNPYFRLGVEFEGRGKQRPRDRDIVRPLTKWLESLDPDQVLADAEAEGLPVKRIVAQDWQMLFYAIAVPPKDRGDATGPMLGFGPVSAGPVDDTQQLRHKLNRYGDPDVPLVVAVNCASAFMKPPDIADALYGTMAYPDVPEGLEPGRAVRIPDGTWMGEHGPTGQRMSAVLTTVQLHAGSMATVNPRLWHNPWAHRPVVVEWPFSSGTVSDRGVLTCDERIVDMAALLGLQRAWPRTEPRFPGER